MNTQCFEVALPQNYIVAHVMEIEQNQIIPLDSRKGHQQNNSNFPQINKIALENHKTNEIQFNLNNSDLDSAKKQILLEFLAKHRENFAVDLTELGKTGIHQHHIETKPGSRSVRIPFYRTSPHASREIDRQKQEMLDNDIIQPSNSE